MLLLSRYFDFLNRFEAPQTLKEMLNDDRYNEALEAMMPDVVAKANSVIANVKSKAAASGEIMDAATEKQLRPQILLEAFGKYSSEGAAREWSTVVDILIIPPSFQSVSLFLSRSPLSKTPKQIFFNPLNIF